MNLDNQTQKPIPVAMTKVQLVKLYQPLSENFVRGELNDIILGSRRTNFPNFAQFSDDQLRQAKIVFRSEIAEFASRGYGLPDGYYLP